MKRRWKSVLAVLLALIVAAAVGRALVARKAEQASLAAAAPAAPVLELAPGDVVAAGLGELTRTLAISGSLKAVETAVIKARVAAELQDLSVREGDSVKAGQVIGHLDATEFTWRLRQAEEQAGNAQSQLDIAVRTLDNNRALVDQGFISKNALDTSMSNAAGARSALQAANAAAELARKSVRDAEIRAPISGVVSERLVQPGERVPLDAKMLAVVDLSRIELEAAVPPEDVGAVALGSVARLQVDGLPQPVTGRVVRINPSTQAGTRAVMTYLAVDPSPGLRQGLFARGVIELQRKTGLIVPATVLHFDQARPYVLAVVDGKVQQRPVGVGLRGDMRRGARTEAGVEITDGIAAGDLLLQGGVGALRAGTPVKLAAATPTTAP